MEGLNAARHQAVRDHELDLGLRPGDRLRAALVLGGGGRRKHGEDCGGRKDAAHPLVRIVRTNERL